MSLSPWNLCPSIQRIKSTNCPMYVFSLIAKREKEVVLNTVTIIGRLRRGQKKLNLELENNNLRKKKKSPPSIIIDPYEMDISNIIDPYEMDISNIDIEPDKHTNLSFGIMFFLFSFMSFIIAIESDDGICGMLGMFSFVIGFIFSLSATEGKKDIVIFFIVICGFFLLLFAFMIDSMFSSGGCFGVCGLSGWGGP